MPTVAPPFIKTKKIKQGHEAKGPHHNLCASLRRLEGNRALSLAADLTVAGNEKIATAAYPEIDILVNNLGTYALRDFFETSDEDWERMFNTNVWSGVRLTRTYMRSEVANVVAFLASDRTAVINGAAIRAEGGTVQTIA